MKRFCIGVIRIYQIFTAWLKKHGMIKDACVFYPTCSTYAIQAIQKYGIIKGSYKAMRRITRCHPWQKEHYDPV